MTQQEFEAILGETKAFVLKGLTRWAVASARVNGCAVLPILPDFLGGQFTDEAMKILCHLALESYGTELDAEMICFNLYGDYALDDDRRVAKRLARWQHAQEMRTGPFKDAFGPHLGREMELLAPYWDRPDVTKEQAVAAYHADHPGEPLRTLS
jgi:hypothetical protein